MVREILTNITYCGCGSHFSYCHAAQIHLDHFLHFCEPLAPLSHCLFPVAHTSDATCKAPSWCEGAILLKVGSVPISKALANDWLVLGYRRSAPLPSLRIYHEAYFKLWRALWDQAVDEVWSLLGFLPFPHLSLSASPCTLTRCIRKSFRSSDSIFPFLERHRT